MDLRKLKTLIDLVAESNITELEVTEGEEKVKIVKGGYTGGAPQIMQTYAAAPMMPASASAPSAVAAPVVEAVKPESKYIKSPMVGTFYAASAPDKPDFATVGMTVKAAQTVCIIEAMKLMNEIESGFDGVITEVLVANGTAVEFGQPLFAVA
jgi:acetyl-CoA carboxylase biotin carboxyl carrier protein